MIVGVPTEVKPEEHRVAITPAGTRELTSHGHRVLLQKGAGVGSSLPDEDYVEVGAEIVAGAAEVFSEAELVVKVKEPQPTEIELMRPGQTLFTYLHLAAYPEVARGLMASGSTAVAYETVELAGGDLPLLAPMSEIAGRMAAQAGAHYLEKPRGGKGVLIGGVTGVPPARVTVLGAGMAGTNAAWVAAGMGAQVALLDLNASRLRHVDELHWGRVVTVRSSVHEVEQHVTSSDLVIGAVLVPGARAPVIVSEDLVEAMAAGSVIADISIDQGGCVATSRETSHTDPVYVDHGVIHYAVGNIPGAVPHTATYALTNATLPYLVALAEGLPAAVSRHPELRAGINIVSGTITNSAVANSLGFEYVDPSQVAGV